jgi:hypothetical protein
VSNGELQRGALPPSSFSVANLGSVLRDHNGYWSNRDVFVTSIGNALLAFAELPLAVPRAELHALTKRRGRRVAALRAIVWVAMAAAVTSIVQNAAAWMSILGWAANRVWGAILKPFDAIDALQRVPAPDPAVWGRTFGLLTLILLAFAIARAAWNGWNESQMSRRPGGDEFIFGVSIMIYLLLLIGVISGGVPPAWTFIVSLAAGALTTAFASHGEKEMRKVAGPQPMTAKVWALLRNAFLLVCAAWAVVLGVAALVDKARNALHPWLPRSNTGWSIVAAIALLIVGVVILGIALGLLFSLIRWLSRRRQQASGPPSG